MSAPKDVPIDAIADLALAAAHAALEKKAADVVLLDVRELTSLADYFVIASGRSDTQVRAICDGVTEALRHHERRPLTVEGERHGQWALLDYGDFVVHVFFAPVREVYDLERLWARARRSEITDAPASAKLGAEREAAR